MSLGRMAAVLVGAAALSISGGCGKLGGSPTSLSGWGGASATFVDDGPVGFMGAHPAPLVANGITYV
jgi:hypothetical protein